MTEPRKENPLFVHKPIDLANKLLVDLGLNKDSYTYFQHNVSGKVLEKTPREVLDHLTKYYGLTLIITSVVAPDNPLVQQWGEGTKIREAFSKSAEMEIERDLKIMEKYGDGHLVYESWEWRKETIGKHEKHMGILRKFQEELFTEVSPTAPAFKK